MTSPPPSSAEASPSQPSTPNSIADGTAADALRRDAAVIAALGTDFEITATEQHADGVAFLVHTPTPVSLPVGTMSTVGTGEGGPVEYAPITEPMGPLSYFWVLPVGPTGRVFLPVPDSLAEQYAAD